MTDQPPPRKSSGTMRSTGKLARCPVCDPPMGEERGSGRCGHCHGVGTVPLGVVAGVAPCPECKGKKTCRECLGVGNISLIRSNEILFGNDESPTRRDTPRALELARADEHHDTERAPAPIPRPDPRREPDD